MDFKVSEFAKGNCRFPKEEGHLLNSLEKTYKDNMDECNEHNVNKMYYGPNDTFIVMPSNQDELTVEQFESYKRYTKMRLGLSTPKPITNVIIEPKKLNENDGGQ